MYRYAILAAGVLLAIVAIAHPAPRPIAMSAPVHSASPSPHHAAARAEAEELVVYVAGAVHHPGLYRLRSGARADDAVRAAGGLTRLADAAGVNLAEHVADGDEVAVPEVGMRPARRARRPSSHRRSRRRQRDVSVVQLNAADAAELASVPGIGAAIAQRIVEVRDREGAFDSVDELLDVAGMNAGRLERARPHLRL